MKKSLTLVTVLAVFAALSPAISQADAPKKAVTCPSQNFTAFFKAYRATPAIQKKFTDVPLKFNNFYPDFGEKPNVSYLSASELFSAEQASANFPVFSTAKELETQGVKLTVKRQSASWVRVQTGGMAGTGANTYDFDFKKSKGCWRLVEITDFST